MQADGTPIPPNEPPDKIVTIWEVSPHLGNRDYDCLWERSWQRMLSYVGDKLEEWLESYTEEQLRDGVSLTFKLLGIHLEDLPGEGD